MTLTEYMQAHGLSDAQLAEIVGCDRTRINRLRRGIGAPSWRLAGAIRKATNGEVDLVATLESEAA